MDSKTKPHFIAIVPLKFRIFYSTISFSPKSYKSFSRAQCKRIYITFSMNKIKLCRNKIFFFGKNNNKNTEWHHFAPQRNTPLIKLTLKHKLFMTVSCHLVTKNGGRANNHPTDNSIMNGCQHYSTFILIRNEMK